MMRFTVPGPPVGKARARVVVNHGRAHAFTPEKTARFENLVRMAFTSKFPRHVPLTGPIWLEVEAYFQPPKRLKLRNGKEGYESIPHVTRPDASNVAKAVEDALNGVAYRDDSQITYFSVNKCYSLTPRVEVEIHHHEQPESPAEKS